MGRLKFSKREPTPEDGKVISPKLSIKSENNHRKHKFYKKFFIGSILINIGLVIYLVLTTIYK